MTGQWLALVLLTAAVPVLSADRQTTPPAQPPPVFKAGVELVRLDVRVLDDNGAPVKDLRADEVQVFEGGVQRPVVFFQHVAEPSGSYAEIARRTIGAEVSTNQGSPRGHLYLFVFDQTHIAPGNEMRARQAVDRFLRGRVKPGDRVALYALPGPGPQLPFTPNVSTVLAELPRLRGALDREGFGVVGVMTQFEAFQITRGDPEVLQRVLNRAAESGAAGLEFVTRNSTGSTPAPASATSTASDSVQVVKQNAKTIVDRADGEAHSFLMTLTDVIRQLAMIEGRKSVVLVSEGFFSDNLVYDVERVAAAAAEAYAVIYSLDVSRRGIDFNAAEAIGSGPAQEIQSRLESLGTLAAETDGELMRDASSHLDQVLNRIADSSQDYYIVGFEPPSDALADRKRYRRVSVKLARRGAKVSARTGYVLGEPVNVADRRRSIDSALGAPFPQQGLPIEMTTYVLRGTSPGVHRVVMSLQAELPVAADGKARSADVVFVTRNARDGRVVASGTDTMPLPRAPVSGRTTAQGQFRLQFEAPPGEYLMRVAVREPGGTTGTVDRRFEVRPLDGVDITASDLIVGRRSDALPVRARGYVNEGLAGALEVYARNLVNLENVDVTIDLVPLNGEAAVRSIKADLLDIRTVGSGAGRTAQVVIPLDGVAPGDYVVRATLRANGETVTELVRQAEIAPGSAPAEPPPAREPVTPEMMLGGEFARRFVASLGATATDATVKAAAGYASAGVWVKVLSALDQPTGRQPTGRRPAAFHALRGLALFAAERYDQAATDLETALSIEPASAPTAFFLGWVYANSAKDPQAITAWRNAIVIDPTTVSAYLALADRYVRMGHPELAIQVLKDGVRLVPASPELRNKLAEVTAK